MVIGICRLQLDIYSADSLKAKRRVVKSVVTRLRNQFNVAVAEVEPLEMWQTAMLGVVTVSNDGDYVHGLLTKVARWVDETRLDCELADYKIELLT